MKISTLTFQESLNYGALLQAHALQRVLAGMGHDAEIINYHSKAKEAFYQGKLDKSKSLANNINKLLSFGLRRRRKRVTDAFRRQQMALTPRVYTTKDELARYAGSRDYVICGSDQVWNVVSTRHDATYFLDFVADSDQKIAYAASFGIAEIPAGEVGYYQQHLASFTKLSVREASGITLLKTLVNKEATVVLDPCLLLTAAQWDGIAQPTPVQAPYIFVYYVNYSKKLIDYAKAISAQTGIKAIICARTLRDLKDGFKDVNLGVAQFVDAVKNAAYVITNSFHGTVFSIIYRKQFISFADQRKTHDTTGRVVGLLNELGLQARLFAGDRQAIFAEWDYAQVESILAEKRQASLQFLTEAISSSAGTGKA